MQTIKRQWVAYFSQTGAEIADVCEAIGRWPTRIITNKRPSHLRTIDPRIVEHGYLEISNKPTYDEYHDILQYLKDPIVTLHGWLRIMPPGVCDAFEIYNGHPGLITKYPELKGKDPQVKAFSAQYDEIGSVIHKVVAEVDEGPVLAESSIYIGGFSLEDYYKELKILSLELWEDFLRKRLNIE